MPRAVLKRLIRPILPTVTGSFSSTSNIFRPSFFPRYSLLPTTPTILPTPLSFQGPVPRFFSLSSRKEPLLQEKLQHGHDPVGPDLPKKNHQIANPYKTGLSIFGENEHEYLEQQILDAIEFGSRADEIEARANFRGKYNCHY